MDCTVSHLPSRLAVTWHICTPGGDDIRLTRNLAYDVVLMSEQQLTSSFRSTTHYTEGSWLQLISQYLRRSYKSQKKRGQKSFTSVFCNSELHAGDAADLVSSGAAMIELRQILIPQQQTNIDWRHIRVTNEAGGLSVLTKAAFVEAAELTVLSPGAVHNETTLSGKLLFKHELITVFGRSGS